MGAEDFEAGVYIPGVGWISPVVVRLYALCVCVCGCFYCALLSKARVENEVAWSTYLGAQSSGWLLYFAGWARWKWEWH